MKLTAKQFRESKEPLGLIVSLNPKTGKVIYDTYDWEVLDSFMEDFKKDFPDMLHFMTKNKAAAEEMKKKLFNYTGKL